MASSNRSSVLGQSSARNRSRRRSSLEFPSKYASGVQNLENTWDSKSVIIEDLLRSSPVQPSFMKEDVDTALIVRESQPFVISEDLDEEAKVGEAGSEICQLSNRRSKPDVLSLYPNARCVNLSSNNLSTLSVVPQNICTMILSQNSLKTLFDLERLSSLQYLDVSHNEIKTLIGIHNNLDLDTLIASHNEIKVVQGLENLKKLKVLNLDSNRIETVSAIRTLSCNQLLHSLRLIDNPVNIKGGIRQRMMDMIPSLKHFNGLKLSPSPAINRSSIRNKKKDTSYSCIFRAKHGEKNIDPCCRRDVPKNGFKLESPKRQNSSKKIPKKLSKRGSVGSVSSTKAVLRKGKNGKNMWGEDRMHSATIISMTRSTVKEIQSGNRFSYCDYETDSVVTTKDDEFEVSAAQIFVDQKRIAEKLQAPDYWRGNSPPPICCSPKNRNDSSRKPSTKYNNFISNVSLQDDSDTSISDQSYTDNIEALIQKKQVLLNKLKAQLKQQNVIIEQ